MSELSKLRALVLRAPGINCERETARACHVVGFASELVHINQLLQAPDKLLDYDFLVIPGGFSYGDDLGAGMLLARNLTIHLGAQLQQFINEGRPVLGICNGFQVLVRAGLLPGALCRPVGTDLSRPGNETQNVFPNIPPVPAATLTDNESARFECRWITLAVQSGACIFTHGIERPIELPVAHGEGQFVLQGDITQLQEFGLAPLVYTSPTGDHVAYPDNPNGSIGNVAGVCNARGNVLGLMPHPERYVHALQHPQRRGMNNAQGDGLLIFKNAYTYAQTLKTNAPAANPSGLAQAPAAILVASASYAGSGVDIAAADLAKRLMKDAVRASHGPEVLAGMGAFAGVFDASSLQKMRRPALVSSTDGVGTKTLIAAQTGRFDTIGYDLVNHSINDLLTQGARPLFFMDYLAMGKLEPTQAATIVQSVAAACRDAGCALLGGETAEMPDVYLPGTFDLAGTIVGVVEQDEIVNGSTISAGDVLLGLPSSGLHTNGYSLARYIFESDTLHLYDAVGEEGTPGRDRFIASEKRFPGRDKSVPTRNNVYDVVYPELGEPLVDALLRPHRCYLREINLLRAYLADRGRFIKGMAHITGGGFEGNISRVLPAGMQAVIEVGAWQVPSLFALLARLGKLTLEEQYRTFNMGVGMVLVLSPKGALEARCVLPELLTVGYITEGEGVVLHPYREKENIDDR